jgi:hypothetical protein
MSFMAKVRNENFSAMRREDGSVEDLLDSTNSVPQENHMGTPERFLEEEELESPQILRVQEYLHEIERELDLITPSPSSILPLSEKEQGGKEEEEERLTDDLSDDEFLVTSLSLPLTFPDLISS